MKKLYYTDEYQINSLIGSIARQATIDRFMPDYVVGITRGGLIPAVKLSHYFAVPLFTLNTSFRDSEDVPESNRKMAKDALAGSNILIVDDINDTGKTLSWVKSNWESLAPDQFAWTTIWNNSVRFAVLIDNESSTFDGVDFVGTSINKAEDPSWITFPWEEWWK